MDIVRGILEKKPSPSSPPDRDKTAEIRSIEPIYHKIEQNTVFLDIIMCSTFYKTSINVAKLNNK